ncbi:zinc metalloproteinase nas-14-like [Uloborus diversus]|uniref:zinc metalloproteinase nas-14-like n=1 Tax=Uloborus diversus TaxID=327109 RepID=UPI002409BDE3|nr:zinc metalloproteinase nas-14-like [Uloborus diversus]
MIRHLLGTSFIFLLCFLRQAHLHSDFNPIENKYLDLFEGDIFLRNGSIQLDRNAMPNREGRWPNGVVIYQLDETYTDEDINMIRSAISEFEAQTCVSWVERTDEDIYVEIENDMGCWSELGRVGGVQSLSLEAPLCMKKGVVMHEMMHTLGFLHEQSRHDRDDYINLIWENIVEGMEQNFEKLPPWQLDDLSLDYDYKSIMHYSAHMFAKDRSKPTIEPVNHRVPLNKLGYGQKQGVFYRLRSSKN